MQLNVNMPGLPSVYCRFCGTSILLSPSLITRTMTNKQTGQNSIYEFSSRLFPARCQTCREEAMYTLSQIPGFPAEEPWKL